MIRVYGYSDDLVEIEFDRGHTEEINCYNRTVRVAFIDGTVILIGFCKPTLSVWWIKVEHQGTAHQTLTICEDEDAEIYSDIFEIDSNLLGFVILPKGGGEDG